MDRMTHSSGITLKTYRNFAFGTLFIALVVALGMGETRAPSNTPEPVAKGTTANGTAKVQGTLASGSVFDALPQDDGLQGADGGASEPVSGAGAYELSTAVTGAMEDPQKAASEGHEPRQLATAEQVRALIDESRARAGPPTRTTDSDEDGAS